MDIEEPTGNLKWVVRERMRTPPPDSATEEGSQLRIACRTPLTTETRYSDAEMALLRGESLEISPVQVIRYEQTDFGGMSHRTRQLRLEIRRLRSLRKEELSSTRNELEARFTVYQTRQRITYEPETVFVRRRMTRYVQLPAPDYPDEIEDRDQARAWLEAEADRLVSDPAWVSQQVEIRDVSLESYSLRILRWKTRTITWSERKWIPLSRGRSFWKTKTRRRMFRVPSLIQVRLSVSWTEARIRRKRISTPYTKRIILPEFRKHWFDASFEIRDRYDQQIRSCLARIEELRIERRLNAAARFHCMETGTTAGFIPNPSAVTYRVLRDSVLPSSLEPMETPLAARYAAIADTLPTWRSGVPQCYWDWNDRSADPNHIRVFRFRQLGCHMICAIHRDDSGHSAQVSIFPDYSETYTELAYDSAGSSPIDVRGVYGGGLRVVRDEREDLYSESARETLVRGAQLRAALRLGDLRTSEDTSFSVVRSTAELKDLPETFRQAVSFLQWCRQSGLQGVAPLKTAATAYLAYKFAVQPTVDDTKTLLKATHDFLFDIYRSRTRIIRQLMGYTTTPVLRRRYSYPLNAVTRSQKSWILTGHDVLSDELHVEVFPRRVAFGEYVGFDKRQQPLSFDSRLPWDPTDKSDERLVQRAFYALTRDRSTPLAVDGTFVPLTTAAPSATEALDEIITSLTGSVEELPVDGDVPVCQKTEGTVFAHISAQAVANELSRSWGVSPFEYATLLSQPAWLAWELYPLSFVMDWVSNSHEVVDTIQSMLNKLVTGVEVEHPTWATERTEVLAGVPEYALVPSLLIAGGDEYNGNPVPVVCPPDVFGDVAYRMDPASYQEAFHTFYADSANHPRAVAHFMATVPEQGSSALSGYTIQVLSHIYRTGLQWRRTGLYRACRYSQRHDPITAITAFGFLPRVKPLMRDLGKLITLTALLKG